MTVRGHQYERRGLLAIDPKAFWEIFFCDDEPSDNTEIGEVTIVDVRGPLEQHSHPWCDSYEDIVARVRAACQSSCKAVVLRFDSPGGDAQGCFDAADEIPQLCAAAGKQLHAYVDGDCSSAAYALASQCESITISVSALVGSIGVLSCRDDVSSMNAQRGLRVALITSGARKADGHPDQPITDAELASTQAIVDSMAGVFFELVARGRGMAVEAVAQLQAKVFHGASAVSAGLVDEIGPLSKVLARVAGDATGDPIMGAYEKARANLQEAAKGDDANAAAARAALEALENASGAGEEDPPAEPEPEKKPDEGAAAPAPAPAASDPPKDPEALAAAAYRLALKAERDNMNLRAELKKRDDIEERRKLIASRPGLAPEMVALLERAPMDLVRETIAALPAAPTTTTTLERAPLRGEAQGQPTAARLPPSEKQKLDERMGLVAAQNVVTDTEYKQTFGTARPSEIAKRGQPDAKN